MESDTHFYTHAPHESPAPVPAAAEASEGFARFLADCTVGGLDDTAATPVADLYGMYIIWCEQSGSLPASVQAFSAAARGQGLEPQRRHQEQVYPGLLPTGPIPIQYILETDKAPSPNSALNLLPGT